MKKRTKSIIGLIMIFGGLAVCLGGLTLALLNIVSFFTGVNAAFICGVVMFVLGAMASTVGFFVFLDFNRKDIIRASVVSTNYAMIKKVSEAAEKQEEPKAKIEENSTKKDAVK